MNRSFLHDHSFDYPEEEIETLTLNLSLLEFTNEHMQLEELEPRHIC